MNFSESIILIYLFLLLKSLFCNIRIALILWWYYVDLLLLPLYNTFRSQGRQYYSVTDTAD